MATIRIADVPDNLRVLLNPYVVAIAKRDKEIVSHNW